MSAEVTVPFVTTGTYPVRGGNAFTLLVDVLPAFERLCEAIEHARHSVSATITFLWPEFAFPGGRGVALEVLARVALFAEHLGVDTSGMDDVAALRAFAEIASRHRERFEKGDAAWQGLGFRLEPSS